MEIVDIEDRPMNGRLAPTVGCKCYRFVTFRLPQNVTSVCVCVCMYIHRKRVCVIYMFIYFSPKNSRWKGKCPTPGEPANASRVLIGCCSVPNCSARAHARSPCPKVAATVSRIPRSNPLPTIPDGPQRTYLLTQAFISEA